jgi:aldehyde:ferredoxin oxidoreductase
MTAFDSGPIAGSGITAEALEHFKRRFYETMKWDPESGAPTAECLQSLQLDGLLEAVA